MEVALITFAFFAGIALIFHGFNFGFITIHKHYHGRRDDE
ncbi:hypothetical protein J2W97_000833 [Paenibacillus jamilae]|jgi:hypothetical protein|nr:hypothetical protein [Paenibacillus jamilae]